VLADDDRERRGTAQAAGAVTDGATAYSYENGTTCVVTESLTAVDGIIRHDVVDFSCS
jgi:hypothetical protein